MRQDHNRMIGLLLAGCACTSAPVPKTSIDPPTSPPLASFFALGDWGTGSAEQRAVAIVLREELAAMETTLPAGAPDPFVVGLGDNLYPKGFPAANAFDSQDVRDAFARTFTDVYRDVRFRGRRVDFHVVSGNHDWGTRVTDADGWGDVAQNEAWAEGIDPAYHYYPFPHGRLGIPDTNDEAELDRLRSLDLAAAALPEVCVTGVSPELLQLIAVDSQAILSLTQAGRTDAVERHWHTLDSLAVTSKAQWTIVFAHHPVRTHGFHGGHAGVMQWLWSGPRDAFTKYVPWFLRPLTAPFAPLGVAGDRWLTHSLQDTDNRHNESLQRHFTDVFERHDVRLMLSGHDHNLQLIDVRDGDTRAGFVQVVSGSAGQHDSVAKGGRDLLFSDDRLGYVRIDVRIAEVVITFVGVDASGDSPRAETLGVFAVAPDGSVSVITAPPSNTSPS